MISTSKEMGSTESMVSFEVVEQNQSEKKNEVEKVEEVKQVEEVEAETSQTEPAPIEKKTWYEKRGNFLYYKTEHGEAQLDKSYENMEIDDEMLDKLLRDTNKYINRSKQLQTEITKINEERSNTSKDLCTVGNKDKDVRHNTEQKLKYIKNDTKFTKRRKTVWISLGATCLVFLIMLAWSMSERADQREKVMKFMQERQEVITLVNSTHNSYLEKSEILNKKKDQLRLAKKELEGLEGNKALVYELFKQKKPEIAAKLEEVAKFVGVDAVYIMGETLNIMKIDEAISKIPKPTIPT